MGRKVALKWNICSKRRKPHIRLKLIGSGPSVPIFVAPALHGNGHWIVDIQTRVDCCRRACGTARYAYNWGLAEWQRMREAGEKPSMLAIKSRWNAHRKAELP